VPVRASLLSLIAAVLAVGLLAGCGGGSGDATATLGDETLTMPSDVHGFYPELEAILAQLPYEAWYAKCVVSEVKKSIDPEEAEKLAELPEDERESLANQATSKAGPICEAKHRLPVVDPKASPKELNLLRAGYVSSMKAVAESKGATASQATCVEEGFEELSDKDLIAVVNGAKTVREGILLEVFKPCTATK
jgi:hypothetical protein